MSFRNKFYINTKFAFDFIVSIILLSALAPLLLFLVFLVLIFMGQPVIFKQIRAGINGKLFNIYKLRTMKESNVANSSDNERLTPLGIFLRKTSLDELPQLINVLKGDIALVGPRPLLPEYTALYNQHQKRRLEIRPGITGWAQINGRNSLSWQEKFDLDVWYIDHCSLWLDCKILFLTVFKVFLASGINARQNVTMEKFKGNF